MHAIHNARIQLLATLLNNAALAFIVAAADKTMWITMCAGAVSRRLAGR
jgi:hypothetical protein